MIYVLNISKLSLSLRIALYCFSAFTLTTKEDNLCFSSVKDTTNQFVFAPDEY